MILAFLNVSEHADSNNDISIVHFFVYFLHFRF